MGALERKPRWPAWRETLLNALTEVVIAISWIIIFSRFSWPFGSCAFSQFLRVIVVGEIYDYFLGCRFKCLCLHVCCKEVHVIITVNVEYFHQFDIKLEVLFQFIPQKHLNCTLFLVPSGGNHSTMGRQRKPVTNLIGERNVILIHAVLVGESENPVTREGLGLGGSCR